GRGRARAPAFSRRAPGSRQVSKFADGGAGVTPRANRQALRAAHHRSRSAGLRGRQPGAEVTTPGSGTVKGPTGSARGTSNPRYPLSDSLRAIAALSVFVFHLPLVFRMSVDNPVRPYLLSLNVGVAVFFLVSGFLLYRPFASARYLGKGGPA